MASLLKGISRGNVSQYKNVRVKKIPALDKKRGVPGKYEIITSYRDRNSGNIRTGKIPQSNFYRKKSAALHDLSMIKKRVRRLL